MWNHTNVKPNRAAGLVFALALSSGLVSTSLAQAALTTPSASQARAKSVSFSLDDRRVEGTSGEKLTVSGRVTGVTSGSRVRLELLGPNGKATPVASGQVVGDSWQVTIPNVKLGGHQYRIKTLGSGPAGAKTFTVTGFNWFAFGQVARPWNWAYYSSDTLVVEGAPLAVQWYRNQGMTANQEYLIGNGRYGTISVPAGCTKIDIGGVFSTANGRALVTSKLKAVTAQGEFLEVEYTSADREGREMADVPRRAAFSVVGHTTADVQTTAMQYVQRAGGQAYCPFAWPTQEIRQ